MYQIHLKKAKLERKFEYGDMWLSRYTPKINGSKISHLPIDRVHPTYVQYRKYKGKPNYPNAISSCL